MGMNISRRLRYFTFLVSFERDRPPSRDDHPHQATHHLVDSAIAPSDDNRLVARRYSLLSVAQSIAFPSRLSLGHLPTSLGKEFQGLL